MNARLLLPSGLLVGVVVLGVASRLWPPLSINHDCGWYLHVAAAWLDGARLYVDIVDVNPPLIVYVSALPVAMARWLGSPAPLVFELFVLALAGASIWSWQRVATRPSPLPAVIAYLAIAYPRYDFGQREHLLVLGVAPYVALAAARLRGDCPGRLLALAIGVMAGLCCALKPHYLLLPALVQVHAALRARSLSPLARAEHVGVWLAVAIYAVHFALLPGDVWQGLAHFSAIAWQTYGAYDEPLAALLREPLLWRAAALGTVGTVLLLRSSLGAQSVPLVLAWVTALLAAVAQRKGWSYHFLPALFCGWWLAASGVCAWLQRRSAKLAWVVVGLGVLLGAARIVVDRADDTAGRLAQRTLARELRDRAAGGAILALDTQIGPYFPAVNDEQLSWCSRLACLWPLPAMNATIDAELAAIILADVERRPPSLVIVRQPPLQGCTDPTYDVRDWLQRQPALAVWWQGFIPAGARGDLLFFRRRQ